MKTELQIAQEIEEIEKNIANYEELMKDTSSQMAWELWRDRKNELRDKKLALQWVIS